MFSQVSVNLFRREGWASLVQGPFQGVGISGTMSLPGWGLVCPEGGGGCPLPRYWHLMVATEAVGTHPTGIFSCFATVFSYTSERVTKSPPTIFIAYDLWWQCTHTPQCTCSLSPDTALCYCAKSFLWFCPSVLWCDKYKEQKYHPTAINKTLPAGNRPTLSFTEIRSVKWDFTF